MKNLIQAAVVTLFAASTAQAQQAVQWRVQDGGNGHWYGINPSETTWQAALASAHLMGAALVDIESAPEDMFVARLWATFGLADGAWGGGHQEGESCGPNCGWAWSSGAVWSYTNWYGSEPNDFSGPESRLELLPVNAVPGWFDAPDSETYTRRAILEWSADCNNDGIVDYGQCRDGTLPDYNGNNIPDYCEEGTPCVVGNYPVQWRTAEGGNGHWYQYRTSGLPWLLADSEASSLGGYLACIASGTENDVVTRLGREIAWLGGYQDLSASDYVEPAGGWRWVSGEPWTYTNWYLLDPAGPEPNNLGPEHVLITWSGGASWNDMNGAHPNASLIEWSADCNNDGIVDKGQILRGQLPDTNSNGIPDGCEVPSCIDADIYRDFNVNGADLGILLSQWGPNTPLTESDLNGDGVVNGADLGLLLSFWGACP